MENEWNKRKKRKRCPKCKAKTKWRSLVEKYYCWECEKYYELEELINFK